MIKTPIQVLIVDDHPVVRQGTRALLNEVKDIEVVGEARNGREAVEQVERLRPHIVLMDLVMLEMDGIEATHGRFHPTILNHAFWCLPAL
jgi:DNA-binding NarL/FixJ family response regulator